jgi:hypothetical protein
MNDIIPAGANLKQLAEGINVEHAQAEAPVIAGLLHSKTAGALLLQAKVLVPHGGVTVPGSGSGDRTGLAEIRDRPRAPNRSHSPGAPSAIWERASPPQSLSFPGVRKRR